MRYFLRVIDILPDVVEYDEVVVGEVLEEPSWCKGKRNCYFVVPLPPRPRRATFTYRTRGQHDERIIVLPSSYREQALKAYADKIFDELLKIMIIDENEKEKIKNEISQIINEILKYRTPDKVGENVPKLFNQYIKLINNTEAYILPYWLPLKSLRKLLLSIFYRRVWSLVYFLRDEIMTYHHWP